MRWRHFHSKPLRYPSAFLLQRLHDTLWRYLVASSRTLINRRRFLKSIAAAASAPTVLGACRSSQLRPTALAPDPHRLLDLPQGFEWHVVSRAGDRMSDGLQVPPAHDGMAAFAGADNRVVLICNHEMKPDQPALSAFGEDFKRLPAAIKGRVYDTGGEQTPGAGGTTTTIYNPATRTTERQFLSLAGTELNCAGGKTPWNSWLSCEETFAAPGITESGGAKVIREKKHGYVFEVSAAAEGLVEPVPLKAMGRFEHEAAAVHEPSGIVYLTEDKHHSLFYRFIPAVPGRLSEGGRLQALAVRGQSAFATHNWSNRRAINIGEPVATHWIDLDNVDSAENDLRLRGAAKGAATFARGEGLTTADGSLVFTCTIGGPDRLGQVFSYAPSLYEGSAREQAEPGQLRLIAEANHDSLLRNADNLTMAPWGDLIVCEDTADHCGLVGIRADGSAYALADNAYSESELAGVCFSPDGSVLFVNIQRAGLTLAITGPWPT